MAFVIHHAGLRRSADCRYRSPRARTKNAEKGPVCGESRVAFWRELVHQRAKGVRPNSMEAAPGASARWSFRRSAYFSPAPGAVHDQSGRSKANKSPFHHGPLRRVPRRPLGHRPSRERFRAGGPDGQHTPSTVTARLLRESSLRRAQLLVQAGFSRRRMLCWMA